MPHRTEDIGYPRIFELLKFSAVNGIAVTMREAAGSIEITMDAVIYCEGFNKDTFKKTLDALNECVEKAEQLMGMDGGWTNGKSNER